MSSKFTFNLQDFVIVSLLENYLRNNNKSTLFISQSQSSEERKQFARSLKNKKIEIKEEKKESFPFKFDESSVTIDHSLENIINSGLEKLLISCYESTYINYFNMFQIKVRKTFSFSLFSVRRKIYIIS